MTTIENLYELCNRATVDEPNAGDAAAKVMAELGCPKKWAAVFLPLVVDECRRRYRSATLSLERSADRSDSSDPAGQAVPGTHTSSAGGVGARLALLDRSFAVGDGRFVSWGEATVEDHRLRVEMLGKLRSGLDRTIAEHVDAIAVIEAAGVACLAQIEAVAA